MFGDFAEGPDVKTFRVGPAEFVDHMEELKPYPKWWGVTSGRLTYLTLATSSSEAFRLVANEIGISVDQLLIVPSSAELYEPEVQQQLAEMYEGRRVIRTLAFSVVEWPSDLDNLTPEQTAHGIKHGWLDENGNLPKKDSD